MPENQGFHCFFKKEGSLNSCKENQNRSELQWFHVLFTDESNYSFTCDSKRVYIWSESGTRNHPSNITERGSFGGGGVMVWAGIMIEGRPYTLSTADL